MKSYCLLLVLVLFSCAKNDPGTSGTDDASPAERKALTALYLSLGGDNWTRRENWCTDAPLEQWYGVGVADGAVVRLSLVDNGLTGTIAPEVGDLKRLELLDLHDNRVTGGIPDALYDLGSLNYIDLSDNELTGAMSDRIGQMKALECLYLEKNRLQGTVPASLFKMESLIECFLGENEFDGAVPLEALDFSAPEYAFMLMPQKNGRQLYIGADDSNPQRHADGEVEIYRRASLGKGIDLIVTCDGFTAADHALGGTAEVAMKRQIDLFFETEPYRSLREYFNVYILYAYSAENGMTYSNWQADTRFGVTLSDPASTRLTCNTDVLDDFLETAGIDYVGQCVVVVSNSLHYAGTCTIYFGTAGRFTSLALVPLTNYSSNTFAHEVGGHGIGFCDDEYCFTEDRVTPAAVAAVREEQMRYRWWLNVDFTDDPQQILWSRLLFDDRYTGLTGIYEGALYGAYGVYRSTQNSLMSDNNASDGKRFNAVCREMIYRQVMLRAYGADWNYDYEEFVRFDAPNRLAPVSARVLPSRNVRKPVLPRPTPPIVSRMPLGR